VRVEPARSKMKKILQQIVPEQAQEFTWKVIRFDNVINWVLGISLILVPDFFNRIFFGHEVLSHWIYIVIGVGLIWFAAWQTDNFLKRKKLARETLRFAAALSWLSAIVLTFVLISSLQARVILFSKIILWLADVYMLLLGGWWWWMADQPQSD